MKTLQEFCIFMKEYLDEGPKLNLNMDTNKWLGPPSGLERSIGRKNMPPVRVSNKEITSFVYKKDKKNDYINLEPANLKPKLKNLNVSLQHGIETSVAHELGHNKDREKGDLPYRMGAVAAANTSGDYGKAGKEAFKAELVANREGEKLLAKHGRSPMATPLKKYNLSTYHNDALDKKIKTTGETALRYHRLGGKDPQRIADIQDTQSKALQQFIKYNDRLTKQHIGKAF